jgi:hypothetical protein
MAVPGGARGPATGDAVLARYHDRGRVGLRLSGIRASWEVSAAGELSAFARLDDTRALEPAVEDLRGWWIAWEHPTLGPWGGVVADVAVRSDGVLELAARGWLALLDKRLTRRRNASVTAHAGAIAARIVRTAGATEPTGIVATKIDEFGEHVGWRDDGGDVLSALGRLADMSDQEYGVGESDRIFYWRRRYGTDLSETVQLVQGAHIAEWRPSFSLDPVVTEVVLSPNDRQRFATVPAVSGFDPDAYARFGPRQERGTIRGKAARPTARGIAGKQAVKRARLGRLIELTVVNFDRCWTRFRKGDTVRVVLGDLDAAYAVRVLLMSWDQDADVLRVSGEIQ